MFRQKNLNLPDSPIYYPPGTFVCTESGYYYIFSDTKRMRFTTKRVLESWSPQRIVKTTEVAVSKYRITSKMKFRSGTLIHNLGDGRIYLVCDKLLRHVTSPDVLERLGARYQDVIRVSRAEIDLHEKGEDLD